MASRNRTFDQHSLSQFATEVFTRLGLSPEDAQLVTEVLVWANLRGIDTHGVLRIPLYVQMVKAGTMNPRPNMLVEKKTPATLLIHADRAFGAVATVLAMEKTIAKAREVGICWTLIRSITHQGALGYHPLIAARQNMAGVTMASGLPNTAPHGAKSPGVSNSPIAIAVPASRHAPLLLDMATSVAARGKIRLAIEKVDSIPQGWALDRNGNPTTDPNQAAALLPVGSYKGSGLALMFECLSSLMVGNPLLGPALLDTDFHDRPYAETHTQNSLLAAIDIATFTDVETYKQTIDELISALKSLPRAEGVEEIFVPGEPEERVYRERIRKGIPLPQGTIRNLQSIADRLEVNMPPGL